MNKRVLILSHALELGGAERSLIGLLWALDSSNLDIDLFLLRHDGELMQMIPSYINLLPEMPAYTVLGRPMKQTLKEGHFLLTCGRFYGKIKAAVFERKHQLSENGVALEYSHKYTYRLMPKIRPEVEYDVAVSFLTPHYIVAHNVRAKKKICWIHTDYKNVAVDKESEIKMWDSFDYIISISENARENFSNVFPELRNKVTVIENILPQNLIVKQAEERISGFISKDNEKIILSIGRFCTAKNFDNIPEICKRILELGHNIKWYLIGFGPDEELIKQKIREFRMQEHVIILGKKDNPYPYIKACDIYVQPSRYEGKCVAVREAQMLGKPVIITNYSTSHSQLEDGVDGQIVPMNNAECAEGIAALLNNPDQMISFCTVCMSRDYSNKEEIDKIYQMIED